MQLSYSATYMENSPNKFDRTLAILTQLQSKKIVRAQDLAERFGVSLRTIYRDIRSLEASGVPLYGEAGTGYSLVEGYKLPPVMFTREEAAGFIAAEKLVQKFTDKALGDAYTSGMYKIKSILRNTDKDWLQNMESSMVMQQSLREVTDPVPDVLSILLKSSTDKVCVIIHYQSFEASTTGTRQVEPVGVFHDYNSWYVVAYCHLRQDYRQFRTDRIFKIELTQQPFTKTHEPLAHYLKKDDEELADITVRMVVDPKFAKHLSTEKHHHGYVSETITPDGVEMLFVTYAIDVEQWFPRWFMMFADCARILEPKSLIDRINNIIQDYSNRHIPKHPEGL